MEKQGNIRIASENMMPIIKKWLYSEKDIFLREIVANAQDAITKHKKLADLGETAAEENYRVTVTTDAKAGTLTVEDNGIGMTEEEVEKYITQIAFPERQILLTSMKKRAATGSSVISVSVFTPLIWCRPISRSLRSPIVRTLPPCTGSRTATQLIPSATAIRSTAALGSSCTLQTKKRSF